MIHRWKEQVGRNTVTCILSSYQIRSPCCWRSEINEICYYV